MTTETAPDMDAQCARPLDEIGGVWFVAQVLSRHEKRVARFLATHEVFHYLPVYERKGNILPLFPGYLFLCCADTDLYDIRRHESCYAIIEVNNQARFVRELSAVQSAIENCSVRPYTLPVKGQRCEIKSGPMQGQKGKIIKADERRPFVMEVEMLGQAVEVSINPDLLEPAD